jgi:hypothetical protein
MVLTFAIPSPLVFELVPKRVLEQLPYFEITKGFRPRPETPSPPLRAGYYEKNKLLIQSGFSKNESFGKAPVFRSY